MSHSVNAKSKLHSGTYLSITWPIFIEVFLQTFIRFSDTFMLSFVSNEAVAAVGVVNQILTLTFVLFNFTAMGSGVVVSQYVGARMSKDVTITTVNSLIINLVFGVLVSIFIVWFRIPILNMFNLEAQLFEYASTYIIILGSALFIQATILTLSSALQAKGYTKDVMLVVLFMNVFNILGNYLFIFGQLGFPRLGVTGVAIATVFSQLLAMVALVLIFYFRSESKIKYNYFRLKFHYVKKVLKIGIPAAGEHLAYGTSQIVITIIITTLGASALATKVYTQNFVIFISLIPMSMSKGIQIYIGQLIGARRVESAYKEMYKRLLYCLLFVLALSVVFAVFSQNLMYIFTKDMKIIKVASALFLLGIIIEPGRAINNMSISALRATGDARFPAIMGIVSMWGISVPLSYMFGIHMGLGLIGIWIAMAIDEWFRAVFMLFRWKSRKWEDKILVDIP